MLLVWDGVQSVGSYAAALADIFFSTQQSSRAIDDLEQRAGPSKITELIALESLWVSLRDDRTSN